MVGETGFDGPDDLFSSLFGGGCTRVDDRVSQLPAPGLTLMEHLDELVVDGSQGHGPRSVQTVAGGQYPGGAGEGHDLAGPVMNESQLLETPAYPWIAQAARAQSHDGTLSHRMVEYLAGDASLNSAVVGLGHRYER